MDMSCAEVGFSQENGEIALLLYIDHEKKSWWTQISYTFFHRSHPNTHFTLQSFHPPLYFVAMIFVLFNVSMSFHSCHFVGVSNFPGFCFFKPKWATKKDLPTFQYTGCLIGILIVIYYNPHITGWYNSLYTRSSWWLNQPIWKICASQIGSFPQGSGWKFQKCLSCHHLDKGKTTKSSILIGFGTIINHPYWGTIHMNYYKPSRGGAIFIARVTQNHGREERRTFTFSLGIRFSWATNH